MNRSLGLDDLKHDVGGSPVNWTAPLPTLKCRNIRYDLIQSIRRLGAARVGLLKSPWWRYQVETFSALRPFVKGMHRSPVSSSQRPVTRSFDVFFDLRLNKWLNKHQDVGNLRRHSSHYDVTVMGAPVGAYGRLSGHPAGPVLGWVARVEYPVPKHYTCQAVRSGFRESFSWLYIVLRMRRKIEVPHI